LFVFLEGFIGEIAFISMLIALIFAGINIFGQTVDLRRIENKIKISLKEKR